MKIKQADITKVSESLKKLKVKLVGYNVFFPVDKAEEANVDEYGMVITEYKSETYYGNTLATGIIVNCEQELYEGYDVGAGEVNKIYLAYSPTTNFLTFNLSDFIKMTYQPDLTPEDIALLTSYECAIIKKESLILSHNILKD